jgi:hypothetical protein
MARYAEVHIVIVLRRILILMGPIVGFHSVEAAAALSVEDKHSC